MEQWAQVAALVVLLLSFVMFAGTPDLQDALISIVAGECK